jgi:hypothetical protein
MFRFQEHLNVPGTCALKSQQNSFGGPKGNWTGLANALAVEIHGEARLAA